MEVGDQHGFDYREGGATSGPGVCVPSEGPGAERAREFVPSLRDSVDLDSLSRHFRARLSHAAASRLDLGRLGRLAPLRQAQGKLWTAFFRRCAAGAS